MAEAETIAAQAATANKSADLDQLPHDRRDIEVLYKIYVDKRLESQVAFYESRIRENQANADFTFNVGAAVMTISALVATLSATGNLPVLSLLSAILPAFAALLASFRQLYGWERQISIYRDALLGLERVKLITPDKDRMPLADLPAIYPKLVTNSEFVFTGEVNQWGQFVQNTDQAAEEETTDTRSTNALMSDLRLSDEQIDTIRKIVAAGTPKAAFSQQTITVHPEETSALPAGARMPTPSTAPSNMPTTVTTTRTDSSSIHPQETNTFFPADDSAVAAQTAPADPSAPISVTTTRVDTTVMEHVIPGAEVPTAEAYDETQSQSVEEYESSMPEAMDALTPGATYVDEPQTAAVQQDIDALASHEAFANEPPPPEAINSLSPGLMHVDAPQSPPDNPNPEADPNANG